MAEILAPMAGKIIEIKVNVGDQVQEDDEVAIIEAMKIMNEVTAKVPAIVEAVLVNNGDPVEYGQPLFAVRPLA